MEGEGTSVVKRHLREGEDDRKRGKFWITSQLFGRRVSNTIGWRTTRATCWRLSYTRKDSLAGRVSRERNIVPPDALMGGGLIATRRRVKPE